MVDWLKESRNPKLRPTLNDFREAEKRLKEISIRTPILPLKRYREEDSGILLKPEVLQQIGSYKIRGVYNWIAKLTPQERSKGFTTLSHGNLALAVACVANMFSVPSRVAVDKSAPSYKIEACKKYGAEIELVDMNDSFDNMESFSRGYNYINPLLEYGLMDGYGTIGLEIIEDVPDVDTIYVPMGAGLLSCGIALAAKAPKSSVKVVGVNAENSPHYYAALRGGNPSEYNFKSTIADGIAGGSIMDIDSSIDLAREVIDEVVLVPEDRIVDAIRFLALENKLVVEGAGAIGLAAALAIPKEDRGRSVCVLSGGSIDAETLAHILLKQV